MAPNCSCSNLKGRQTKRTMQANQTDYISRALMFTSALEDHYNTAGGF